MTLKEKRENTKQAYIKQAQKEHLSASTMKALKNAETVKDIKTAYKKGVTQESKRFQRQIEKRLNIIQNKNLTKEQQNYYENTIATLTSEKFRNFIKKDKNGNLVINKNAKVDLSELQHAWRILKKDKTPSKLSGKAIERRSHEKEKAEAFDFIYGKYTESESKAIIDEIGERDENGNFSKKGYEKLRKIREQYTQKDLDKIAKDKKNVSNNNQPSLFNE